MSAGLVDIVSPRSKGVATTGSLAIAVASSLAVSALFALHPLGLSGDYPNHLARIYIEARIGVSAELARYYEVAYGFIPDMAMDLAAPTLSQAIGIYPAGAVFIVAAALLGPWAGYLLSRRLHGAAGVFAALGFLTIFNFPLEFGFVNFLVATGLALIAFNFWTGMAPTARRTLVFAPVSLVLVASHALGFLLFGYLVLLWEIGAYLRRERGGLARFVFGLSTREALAVAPGLAFLALSFFGGDSVFRAVDAPTDILGSRVLAILAPFKFYSDAEAFMVARVSAVLLYGGVAFGLWRGAIEIDRRMHVVLAGMLALVLLLPEHLLGIWGLHFRFGPAFLILLGASLRWRQAHGGAAAMVAAVFAAVFALQLHNGWSKVEGAQAYNGALRELLAALPKGARVLQSFDRDAPVRLGNHAGALAVIENDAYVATLFTNTSPVGVTSEMLSLHLPAGRRLSLGKLEEGADKPGGPAVNGAWSEDYYLGWPRRFTHVLHMKDPGGAPAPALKGACLIAENVFQALYRSEPCVGAVR
jgi:hypothetical protein